MTYIYSKPLHIFIKQRITGAFSLKNSNIFNTFIRHPTSKTIIPSIHFRVSFSFKNEVIMTYATARGFLQTAKVKTRNKIHDVENVSFLAQVYLDRYGEVDDYEDIIYMDFESDMDDYHKFDDCELIIDFFTDIEWSDIKVDYERDYDEEREIRLLQECE